MSEQKTYELHGIKGQPFLNFGEDWSYLERVTITDRAAAQEALAAESGMNADEHDPQPIFMRWKQSEEIQARSRFEFDEGWMECCESDRDAVPFWKDSP